MTVRTQTIRNPDPLRQPITVSWIWRFAAIAGTALIGTFGVYTAWTGFGWWQPAGISYVNDRIKEVVQPLAAKVDEQGDSILSGRIETLKASKQLQLGDRAKWEVQSHTTKDPVTVQLIGQQKNNIDDTVKGIDDQITKLSTQLQMKK